MVVTLKERAEVVEVVTALLASAERWSRTSAGEVLVRRRETVVLGAVVVDRIVYAWDLDSGLGNHC